MRISTRGFRSAVVGFTLISLVLLGGMVWATVSTFRLARDEAEERSAERVSRALWLMDTYMIEFLGQEQARPPSDYTALHAPEKESLRFLDGRAIDPGKMVQRSRLLYSKPRHDWIDLYFQVDRDGHWGSPQIPEEAPSWVLWSYSRDEGAPSVEQLRQQLAGLKRSLPFADLQRNVKEALAVSPILPPGAENEPALYGPWPLAESTPESRLAARSARAKFDRQAFTRRRAQQTLLRQAQCLPIRTGHTKVDEEAGVEFVENADEFDDVMSVEIEDARFATFWLDRVADAAPKLMFVRSGKADGQAFYQGFVADWQRLSAELLGEIEWLLPTVELEPVLETTPLGFGEVMMYTVPARLAGEGTAAPKGWAMWTESSHRRLGYWVLAGWVSVLAVLGVAGWGFVNLISSSSRRTQFAYAVTHELRTPLTTFRLYTDMLAAGLVPEESKQAYLETLNREAGRLSGLVEDVLEYARLENHKVRLNPVNTNGQSLLGAVAQDLETRCRHAGVEPFTKNDIPDAEVVRTDVDLVHQITNVLVNNACRHAAPTNGSTNGSQPPKVLLHLSSDNGHVHVNVIDTGPGVDRLDARDIFKPFRRGRNADARAFGGIGLGLALARTWAELLHGKLELAARHHPTYGGAHFRLTIPARLSN